MENENLSVLSNVSESIALEEEKKEDLKNTSTIEEADDDAAEGGDDAPAEDAGGDEPTEDSGSKDADGDAGAGDSGEDDAGDPGSGDAPVEDASGDDAGAEDTENAGQDQKKDNDEFSGLALVKCSCFGYMYPKSSSWVNLSQAVDDKGWSNVNQKQIESSLMHNVEQCYYSIASFILSNANDDMKYRLWFDNNKSMWKVEVLNSPRAEMSIEQRAALFKHPLVIKIAKQAWHLLLNAKKTYYKTLSRHVEEGELLAVDVVKLGAIMHFLDLQYFLNNVRDLKYINY